MSKPNRLLSIAVTQAHVDREIESSHRLLGLIDEHLASGAHAASDLLKLSKSQLRAAQRVLERANAELNKVQALLELLSDAVSNEPEDS
jgi:hypothetical protein